MKIYPTKVDVWAWPLLLLTLASGPLSMGFGAYLVIQEAGGGWLFIGVGVGLLLMAIGLCWPIQYILTEDTLVVRFGLIRSKYPYEKIVEVYPTRNLLGSPAWSLDRLWIEAEGIPTMISPQEKDAFLADLASRHDAFELKDGKITRRT